MNTRTSRSVPSMATLVAEMTLRNAIRPFLRSQCIDFVVAILVHDRRDIPFYESVARRMVEAIGEPYDDFGHKTVYVDQVVNDKKTDWASTLRHINRAVLFAGSESDIAPELWLALDFVGTIKPPSTVHFRIAARQLGFRISESDAEKLAQLSLEELRLAVRPGRPVSRALKRLPKGGSVEPTPAEAAKPPERRLEDLVGYGEAKLWGLRLVNEMSAWKLGELAWKDIDRGVLLSGPPGSGKTTFVSALAASCDVPLVTGSAAQWQAAGHLGDMLKAMRSTFAQAAASRPCILFIDEADSLGDRGIGKHHEYHDYKRQVVNAALECIDPAGGREGIIVIGATNDEAAIDRALLRPGRLERTINIPLPDKEGREAILRYYLPGATLGDVGEFVRISENWSGADIEKVARDARRFARDDGHVQVEARDLERALPPQQLFTDEQRFRLAVHEAGHAIAGFALRPGSLVRVTIGKGKPHGARWTMIGSTEFRHNISPMATAQHYEELILIQLAGVAAETLIFGGHSAAAGGDERADLAVATDLATMMERGFGFGDGWVADLGSGPRPLEYLRLLDTALMTAVKARLDAAFEKVCELLAERSAVVRRLADILFERLELDADEVGRIFAEEEAGS